MRLLERTSNGDVRVTRDLIGNIPPYAILSHTWGADDEEVDFKDISSHVGKQKKGYAKIRFCKWRAEKDGLKYFWVDTCCIDKSSSAELSEAINSMFRWYHKAAKCYVYLSDVSTESLWESAFRKSRWFSRGWTLQELIAPTSVEFFSSKGQRLGDKRSLEEEIHKATGVPVKALRGHCLSGFDVDKRMSWASNRNTTREEDEAYCLLGIFDVHIPLIYGEGRNAFVRLREAIDKRSNQSQHLLQAAQVPSSPPSLQGQTYNCFKPADLRAIISGKIRWSCTVCNWEDHVTSNSIWVGGRGVPDSIWVGGRMVSFSTLWQRFHHRENEKSRYRCFICRDGMIRSWNGLKNHIKDLSHTYAQLCE